MDQRSELTKEQKDRLLREYELCQEAAHSIESTIWRASAAVGIGSVGTLVLVVNQEFNWFTVAIVGGFVIGINLIWWRMAGRWWSIQHTKFCRMLHIEESIGLYQTRYLTYLDAILNPKRTKTIDELKSIFLPDDDQVHRDLGEDRSGGLAEEHQREGVKESLEWFLLLNIAAWLLYILYSFCSWLTGLVFSALP